MEDVVIVSGARTPIGRYGGGLKDVPAAELGSVAIKAALERAGVITEQVDQVIVGCAGQFGEDAYVSRVAAVKAGLPASVPAYTVNRLCGSGLEAINTAARWIESGDADVIVAGGTESMSRYPYLVDQARWGVRMGDAQFRDGLLQILNDPFDRMHMGVTAENLVERWGLNREELDEFAVQSHQRAVAAINEGRFKEQIVPVEVRQGRNMVTIDTDEHPRSDATLESMATLKPAFKGDGQVTAGNASGINDGAAMVVLMSARKAEELGLAPKLRMVGRANSGVSPEIMGTGPIPATQRVMERTGMTPDDMDVIELNEAFASVALVCSRELGLNAEKTNPNGGAVALGHPVGATGAVLTVKALYELERSNGKFGLVSLCIGGGQGISTIFERVG